MGWECAEFGRKIDAPREKLLRVGANALNDSELLAIFLRTGTRGTHVMALSNQLIGHFGSLYNLITASYDDFCAVRGLGLAKYAQLHAVLELSQRYLKHQLMHENVLTSTNRTKNYLQTLFCGKDREIFIVVFLDNQNRVITHECLFFGTFNSVEIHPREIIRNALKHNAASIILSHNHPSGRSEPSHADRQITEIICQACQLVDLRVLDHIVIGRGESVSFAERGWL